MATLLECSVPTVQAVELGKLPLSLKLGERISFQTGVSLDWLMKGDVTAPVVTVRGLPYIPKAYEVRRSELARPRVNVSDSIHVHMVLYRTILRATSLLRHTFNTDNFVLGAYKLEAALDELTTEFKVPLAGDPWLEQTKNMASQHIAREVTEEMIAKHGPQAARASSAPRKPLTPPDMKRMAIEACALVAQFHKDLQAVFAAKLAKEAARKPARKLVKR